LLKNFHRFCKHCSHVQGCDVRDKAGIE
jgi:hypothetical protein